MTDQELKGNNQSNITPSKNPEGVKASHTQSAPNSPVAPTPKPSAPSSVNDTAPTESPSAQVPNAPQQSAQAYKPQPKTSGVVQSQAPAAPSTQPAPTPNQNSGQSAAVDQQNTDSLNQASTKSLPLGKRLLQQGLISKDQLETALKEQLGQQGKKKKMLGQLLVEMGFISESVLGEALTESSGIKHFDHHKAVLDPNLIKKIPRELAIKCKAVPVSLDGNTISVAINDVYNIMAIDQIRRYFPANYKIVPVYCTETDLLEIIDQYYGYEMSIEGILREIETGVGEKSKLNGEVDGYVNPTVRLVDSILIDAIKRGASDIHFEPEGAFLRLRYRVDGKMLQVRSFHKEYWAAIAVRIKIMSGMNIAETRLPQDGRTTYYVSGREVDFRVATHPTVYGENIVMRILDKKKALVPLEQLGFSESNDHILRKLLKRPEGIIIVTGPTGSGKTTTLYSVLNYINDVDINIMTLENPVEYQLPMIRQSDIREEHGMDFVSGIKSLLRQDPDVIFVGEVRDEATATMAMRAAMTGHRVFTTLHTNDALAAIPRLIDIGIPPHLLAGSLICTMAQRLIRKLCVECKIKETASEYECKILGIEAVNAPEIYKHKGCPKCMNTGYKGRVAVNEILPIDRDMDELIATGATRSSMMKHALSKGFVPMSGDGVRKVLAGVTDVDELVRTIDMTENL